MLSTDINNDILKNIPDAYTILCESEFIKHDFVSFYDWIIKNFSHLYLLSDVNYIVLEYLFDQVEINNKSDLFIFILMVYNLKLYNFGLYNLIFDSVTFNLSSKYDNIILEFLDPDNFKDIEQQLKKVELSLILINELYD